MDLNQKIAVSIFQQTDFSHLSWVYEENSTEDGQDGWSGFICPRCKASKGNKDPCVKDYSANIQLAFQAEEEYYLRSNGNTAWNREFDLDRYVDSLASIVKSHPYLVPDRWYLIHASAKERCQALLKTLNYE